MIQTSGPLRFLKQDSGGYELAEDWWVELPFDAPEVNAPLDKLRILGRRLYVRAGFEWDGASGPTIDMNRWAPGPFSHDCGYRLLKYQAWGALPQPLHDEIRKAFDDLFLAMLLERLPGGWRRPFAWARAHAWWAAVRVGGASSAAPQKRPSVREAA